LLEARAAVGQNRDRLPRVMVTIVIKKNNLSADLALQSAGGFDFREKKSLRKNPARLLAETDDGRSHVAGSARQTSDATTPR
jgi:hypothetical protein